MYIINDYYDDVIANPTKRSLWNLIYAYLLNYDLNDIDCKKIGNVILKVNSKITVNNVLGFYDLAYKLLSNKIIGGITKERSLARRACWS